MTDTGHDSQPAVATAVSIYDSRAILIAIAVNIFAGLILAAILLQADTISRVATAAGVLIVLTWLLGTLTLLRRNRLLAMRCGEMATELGTAKSSLSVCEVRYASQLQRLGIAEITESMEGSRWSPDAVMARAQQQVKFLGVFGHKWALDDMRKSAFRSMLTRIQLNGGKVQFLLLDPASSAAQRLATYRKQDIHTYADFHSIAFYKEMAALYDCFDLRLYSHFPFLRFILVDSMCAISRFKVSSGAAETLKAPQMAFSPEDPDGRWTMYQAFVLLFEQLWQNATDPFSKPVPTSPASPAPAAP